VFHNVISDEAGGPLIKVPVSKSRSRTKSQHLRYGIAIAMSRNSILRPPDGIFRIAAPLRDHLAVLSPTVRSASGGSGTRSRHRNWKEFPPRPAVPRFAR